MTVTLDLRPDVEARVRALAAAQGVTPEAYLSSLIDSLALPPAGEGATLEEFEAAMDALAEGTDPILELHRQPIASLFAGIHALRTWGAAWEDYDADPPTAATVDLALEWAKSLYLDVHESGRTWIEPLITASEEGEAMFEWQIRGRRLTIEVTEGGVSYSKLSGSPGNFHSEDGIPDTKQKRQALWAWLTS